MADFAWCMTANDRGWPIKETAAKLTEVSERARERVQMADNGYPEITAQSAAGTVERNALKRAGVERTCYGGERCGDLFRTKSAA